MSIACATKKSTKQGNKGKNTLLPILGFIIAALIVALIQQYYQHHQ